MKPKPKLLRNWPLAFVVMLSLPAGHVGTAAANGKAAIQALIADPMSLLAMRSSGRRGAGTLAQSKVAYAPTVTPPSNFLDLSPEPDFPPDGRRFPLARPFASEPVSDVPATRDQMSVPSLPGSDVAPGAGFSPGGLGGSDADNFAIGGGGLAPSVSGASGLLPAAQAALAPPLVPSAVPEPGTWLMVVGGFLAVGSALRSRHRSEAANCSGKIGPLPTGDQ